MSGSSTPFPPPKKRTPINLPPTPVPGRAARIVKGPDTQRPVATLTHGALGE